MNTRICQLCNTNEADKRNSHIIPKFLGKPLFKNTKPYHSLGINKSGKSTKVQDTPKEDYILCSKCEKKLEILETYFARQIIAINDYSNRKDHFETLNIGPNKILKCLILKPVLFKLFWYSIIWRISISSHQYFEKFKLPNEVKIEIQTFLNNNLFDSHTEILKNLDKIESFPEYHILVYKRNNEKKYFTGILTAFQMSEDHYAIFTSETILFFYLNDKRIDSTSQLISNKNNDKVKIVLTTPEQWKSINSSVIKYRLLN